MPCYVNWRHLHSSEFVSDRPLLVNSCGVTGNGSNPAAEPDMLVNRPEGRQDYQLLYIWRGQGRYLLDGHERLLPAGTVLLYKPGVPQIYSYRMAHQCRVGWIHFTGSLAAPLLTHAGLMDNPVMYVGELPELIRLLERIIQEMQRGEMQFEDQAMAYFIQLTTLIGRRRSQLADSAGYERAQRIRVAMEHIHAHFDEALSVDTCAQLCALSQHHFIRVFRQQCGLSPYAYLTEVRLSEAAHLLSDTPLPVGEIARRCGYEDALYFSRLFRRKYGVAPSVFREQGPSPAMERMKQQ